ncbi:MAG: TetR family transcriptional regulator C-terminal domain-containing protein [Pseudomonadota bacterium]
MKDSSTRDNIVQTGARIIMAKGYNHAGLQEVLKEAGVPKGSFYHFFRSKEEFGLAVVESYINDFAGFMEAHLGNREIAPLARLRGFFEGVTAMFEADGCWGGCMVGNLGQELADQNEVFRKRMVEALVGWRRDFATCLTEAREQGELPDHLDPADLADFMLDSWEGAVLRMKVTKSIEPLNRYIGYMFGTILKG